MIESRFWKSELLKTAAHIEKRLQVKRWTEKQLCLFERQVILAMFAVRIMLDRGRVTDSLRSKTFRLETHPRLNKPESIYDIFGGFIDDYDFSKTQYADLTILQIANQLIHCIIIYPVKEDKRWERVYVCSDYERKKRLFVLKVSTLVQILKLVGKNYPTKHHRWCDSKGQWHMTST